MIIKFEKLIRWKRDISGTLFLEVLQLLPNSNKANWVSYTQAIHKRPDYPSPSDAPYLKMSKGFATAQTYLSLGYSYISYQREFVMSYIELLTEFVEGKVTVDQFQESFLNKFKQEEVFTSDEEFKILDTFFGDVDSYCDEDSELFYPDFDLTEEELRSSAQETLNSLKAL